LVFSEKSRISQPFPSPEFDGSGSQHITARRIFEKARKTDKLLSEEGLSMRRAAQQLGVSVATVCYHAAYLHRLPTIFVDWLESGEADKFGDILRERQLRSIVKLDGSAQVRAIKYLLNECSQKFSDESHIFGLKILEQKVAQMLSE
jgi:hypothetical protein